MKKKSKIFLISISITLSIIISLFIPFLSVSAVDGALGSTFYLNTMTPSSQGVNINSNIRYYNGTSFVNERRVGNSNHTYLVDEQYSYLMAINRTAGTTLTKPVFISDVVFANLANDGARFFFSLPTYSPNQISIPYEIGLVITGSGSNWNKGFITSTVDNIIASNPYLELLAYGDAEVYTGVTLTNTVQNISIDELTGASFTITGIFTGSIPYNQPMSLCGWRATFPFYIDLPHNSSINWNNVGFSFQLILGKFDTGAYFTLTPSADSDALPTLPPYFEYSESYNGLDSLNQEMQLLFPASDNSLNNAFRACTSFFNGMTSIPFFKRIMYVSLATGLVGFVFTTITIVTSKKEKR